MLVLFPYATDRPRKRFPYATCMLIIANLLLYILLCASDEERRLLWHQLYGFIPDDPSLTGLFTSMFIHSDWVHLIGNMILLWVFGSLIEDVMGWWLFLATYFVCGLAAHILNWGVIMAFSAPDSRLIESPVIGASGAVVGLIGVFAVRFYKTKVHFCLFPLSVLLPRWGIWRIPSAWVIVPVALYEFGRGLRDLLVMSPSSTIVAHWAHIGGFILGMGYALLIRLHREGKTDYLLREARTMLARGEWLTAIECAGGALGRDPESVEAHLLLARAYDVLRIGGRAAMHFRDAVVLSLQSSDGEGARRHYLEAVQAHPEFALEPHFQLALGSQFLQAQDFERALEAFSKVAANHVGAAEGEVALLRCGQIYLEKLDQPAKAIAAFETLLARYPNTHWWAQVEAGLTAARERMRVQGARGQ